MNVESGCFDRYHIDVYVNKTSPEKNLDVPSLDLAELDVTGPSYRLGTW